MRYLYNDASLSLMIVFSLKNSADHDKIPHKAAFHLGPHCLMKYLLTGIKMKRVRHVCTAI